MLAGLGLVARRCSSCGILPARYASSFRRARIKIKICYSKSIRTAINRCLSNTPRIAVSIHTIGRTENSLQGKILRSQVRPSATFPFGSEGSRYERSTKVRVSRRHRSLVVVLFPLGMSKEANDIRRFVSEPVAKSAH